MVVSQFLKPLIGGLFDTEVIPKAEKLGPNVTLTELKMFTRPFGSPSAYESRPKDRCDTNLCMSSALPVPVQFAVCGFSLRSGILNEEDQSVFDAGRFEFRFCGDRVYFEAPIGDLPKTLDTEKDWDSFSERIHNPESFETMLEGAARYFKEKDAPPLRVVMEKGVAIMILPQEVFYVRLVWDKGLRLKNKTTVRAGIWGVRYQPV